MTVVESEPLAEALGALAAPAPPALLDRVVSSWVSVPASVGDVYVAFGHAGIYYLRTAASVPGGAEQFCDDYRTRFRRPLRRASRPPAGLVPALRTGRARDLQVDITWMSAFERAVLEVTRHIPVGETRPYAWVAREIGRPGAVRAVGSALGRNPVPLVIPCHRVTRSDGNPGDYVFGAPTKEALLREEAVDVDALRALADAGVRFVGSDTTRIVCYPTCAHARRITPRHRRTFRTFVQAAVDGYRPCRDCRPAGGGAG